VVQLLDRAPSRTETTDLTAPRLLGLAARRAVRRRSRRYARLGALAVGLVVLVPALVSRLDVMPGLDAPFEQKTIDRSSAPLLLALADLSEYHAATGTFQVVVDVERDRENIPSLIAGERTTFVASGTVDALVDFTGLSGANVVVPADGGPVSISLPAPRVGPAHVDPERSRVVARDRGIATRIGGMFNDNPTSERELYVLAEDRMEQAAASSDLTRRAEDNTRAMLTGLVRSLGHPDVTVGFTR
jgi:hypothetical protein